MRVAAQVLVIVAAVMVGCSPEAPPPADTAGSASPATIGVVEVTNEPLAWVVERLAGPLVEIRFRAAEAPDPAYWKPTTEDVLAMQRADLVVLNGASYEPWLKEVSLPSSRLLDTTAAVHDRLVSASEAVTHSHGPEGEHEHTGTAFTTWLDPTLLTDQARAVSAALAARWPEHGELFAERFAALAADLAALDAELAAATAPLAGQALVFSHPVYQYFQRRYGLAGASVHFEPDTMPDAGQWADLDQLLEHDGADWMIWEAEPTAEVRDALAERGLGVIVVAPCSTPPVGGDFLDAMHASAEALRAASPDSTGRSG
jgi:zinc transport system substrate-binding protein